MRSHFVVYSLSIHGSLIAQMLESTNGGKKTGSNQIEIFAIENGINQVICRSIKLLASPVTIELNRFLWIWVEWSEPNRASHFLTRDQCAYEWCVWNRNNIFYISWRQFWLRRILEFSFAIQTSIRVVYITQYRFLFSSNNMGGFQLTETSRFCPWWRQIFYSYWHS